MGEGQLRDERFAESLRTVGLVVVEGFNDRLRLHELGVASVALMSNKATEEQIDKLVALARENAEGRAGIMLDADPNGDKGAKDLLWRLHELDVDARLVWSRNKYQSEFQDWEPESLDRNKWEQLIAFLDRKK